MALTRRELLKIGAGAGASLALGWRPAWPQTGDLITKVIPSSGRRIPAVGIGTRNYRVGPSAEERAPFKATLRVFAELGGKLVDTAPSYGNSESVVGDLVAELGIRDGLFLATKVDREGHDAGIARMEASFQKLRTDHIELMQVHNLRDTATQLATMRDWKAAGRFRHIGVTTSSDRQYAEMERVMRREALDFIQVDYALDARSAAERLLPLAADRGMAVLVNLPFGRGRLFRAVGNRPLPDWAGEFDCQSWGQFFLKYIIAHPAVTCPIPGTTQEHHARDNIGAARGRLPDAAMRGRMEQFIEGL